MKTYYVRKRAKTPSQWLVFGDVESLFFNPIMYVLGLLFKFIVIYLFRTFKIRFNKTSMQIGNMLRHDKSHQFCNPSEDVDVK